MGKKLIFFFVIGLTSLIIASYYFGFGSSIFERILIWRYWFPSKGVGLVIPVKEETKLLISGDAGSVLQKYGIKYAYADPVYFDSMWSWGFKKQHSWLVFQYFYEGRNRWLIIRKRGDVGWIAKSELNAKEVRLINLGINELKEKLVIGNSVSLGLIYRFQDVMTKDKVREELIVMRENSLNRSKAEIEWEIGDFPDKIFQGEEIKRVFANDVTLLNDNDIELSYVREN